MKNESRSRSCSGCQVGAEGMLCSEQGEEGDPGSRHGVWEQHWGSWSTPRSKVSAAGLLGGVQGSSGGGDCSSRHTFVLWLLPPLSSKADTSGMVS